MRSLFSFPKTTRGFTLIELVIVVGLIAFLSGLALPRLSLFSGKQQLEQAGFDLNNVLVEARSRSVTATQVGAQRVSWGVAIDGNHSYYLGWRLVGSSSNLSVSRRYFVPDEVVISPLNTQTVFSRLSGTVEEGAVSYSLVRGSEALTVAVANNGKIEIN